MMRKKKKNNISLGQPVPKALSFVFLTIAHHLLCILYEQVCVFILHEQVCVQSVVVWMRNALHPTVTGIWIFGSLLVVLFG